MRMFEEYILLVIAFTGVVSWLELMRINYRLKKIEKSQKSQ